MEPPAAGESDSWIQGTAGAAGRISACIRASKGSVYEGLLVKGPRHSHLLNIDTVRVQVQRQMGNHARAPILMKNMQR